MGLFDFFDEANAQFKKDVKKAWDEFCDNDTSDDDDDDFDDDDDDSSSMVLGEIFRPHIPDLDTGIAGHLNKKVSDPIGTLGKLARKAELGNPLDKFRSCTEPAPGTPVYCNLAVVAEHTGIYIGDDEIVHLNGDGNIEIVSPQEFLARLDGDNPAKTIYYAAHSNGKPLCKESIADRARSMVGHTRNYQVVFDNCHQFTCGCISGDFENPCNFFWMVENEIRDKLGSLTWVEWDY